VSQPYCLRVTPTCPATRPKRTLNTKVEGVTVTGTFDLYYEGGVLADYKFVSVWTTMNGVKEALEQQLNLYAHLLGAALRRVQLEMLRRNRKLQPPLLCQLHPVRRVGRPQRQTLRCCRERKRTCVRARASVLNRSY